MPAARANGQIRRCQRIEQKVSPDSISWRELLAPAQNFNGQLAGWLLRDALAQFKYWRPGQRVLRK
jgi:hypothetical protein